MKTNFLLTFIGLLIGIQIHAQITPCYNEDFETSTVGAITSTNQLTGWYLHAGYNGSISASSSGSLSTYFPGGLSGATSCNLFGCCPIPPSASAIIDCGTPGGFIDNLIGNQYPIYSVFGTSNNSGASSTNPQIRAGLFGTKILRLNNASAGDYSVEKLSKTFSVTSSNALFQFAYIPVFASGHSCCDAGAFQVRLIDAMTNTLIPCPNFSVSAPSSQCNSFHSVEYVNTESAPGYVYHPWKVNALDLTAYIGQNIAIEIIVSDCIHGDHFTYVYFDSKCGPMAVYGNEIAYNAGTSIVMNACGSVNICAADGLEPCSWAGANVPPNYSIPSYTNSCFSSTTSSQYTLYMNPEGACAPLARVITTNITPALQLISPTQAFNLCENAQIQITPGTIGPMSGYTYTWSAPSSAIVSGINSLVLTTNAAGVYTIMTSNTSNSCTSTATVAVEICVGIQQQKFSEIVNIYPNPNNGVFQVNTVEVLKDARIAIYNAFGELLLNQQIILSESEINIKQFASGIYMVLVIVPKRSYQVKIIKE